MSEGRKAFPRLTLRATVERLICTDANYSMRLSRYSERSEESGTQGYSTKILRCAQNDGVADDGVAHDGVAHDGVVLLLLLAAVALAGTSCHRGGRERVYPVTGKVYHNGKPAEGATVIFVRREAAGSKAHRPGGQVGRDGSFRLSTYTSYDGAPAGRYAVTIVYPSPERKENGENAGPDLLKGRYADPKATPLSVEVKAGTNNLEPFQIQ